MRPVIKRLELSTTANALIRTNSDKEQEYFNGTTQNHVLALDASLVPDFVDINTLIVGDTTEIPYFDGSGNFVHTADLTRTGTGTLVLGDSSTGTSFTLNGLVSADNRINYTQSGVNRWYNGLSANSGAFTIAGSVGASPDYSFLMTYPSGDLIHTKYTTDNALGLAVNILGNNSTGQIVQVNNLSDLIGNGHNISSISGILANGYTSQSSAESNSYNGVTYQAYGDNSSAINVGLNQYFRRSDNTNDVRYNINNYSANSLRTFVEAPGIYIDHKNTPRTVKYIANVTGGQTLQTNGLYEDITVGANISYASYMHGTDTTYASHLIRSSSAATNTSGFELFLGNILVSDTNGAYRVYVADGVDFIQIKEGITSTASVSGNTGLYKHKHASGSGSALTEYYLDSSSRYTLGMEGGGNTYRILRDSNTTETIKYFSSTGTLQISSYNLNNNISDINGVLGVDNSGNIYRNEVLSISGNTVSLDTGSSVQALVFNSTNVNGSYIEVQSNGTTQGFFGAGTTLFGPGFNDYAGLRGQNGIMLSIGTNGGLSINSSSQVTLNNYTTGTNESNIESFLGVDAAGQIYRANNAKNLVSYTRGFTTGDWVGAGPYTYSIAAVSHNLGTGFFNVSLFDNSGNQVGVQNIQIVSGDITITSTTQFDGTIYIS